MNAERRIDVGGGASGCIARRAGGGYILLEATVALLLLSIGAYAAHGVIRQAIETRGQAQDYTTVRFLLEQLIAQAELQRELVDTQREGTFTGEYDRFSWTYTVRRVNLPPPPAPEDPWGGYRAERPFQYSPLTSYIVHVSATVTWRRAGREYSETMETLLTPYRRWLSPGELTF